MTDHDEAHDDKSFRVLDKRRFTSEGDAKPHEEETKASDKTADSPEPAANAPVPPETEEKSAPKRQATPDPAKRAPRPPIDFMGFVMSLATNALAALGALPHAEEHGLSKNLDLAREYIDILAMLMEKTRGNLTKEEEQTLSQLVTDLRLHYVHLGR